MSKSAAFVRVSCDQCHAETEVELCALAGRGSWDERHVDKKLSHDGWTRTDDKRDLCDACTDDYERDADE